MSNSDLDNKFELSSGNSCQLLRIRKDLIPNYYILAFPKTQGEPSSEEVAEMLKLGTSQAQKLAEEVVGDPEAFTVLYSGYSARREKGWHVHIVLLGNRWKKAWLYMILSGKNLAQAFGLRKDDAPRIQ
ncbi:MAG: hypothetical protein L3J46_00910 [Kangiellaceae bacterium]|nr:hypothetical protein [Kangiellaceae bacterium]